MNAQEQFWAGDFGTAYTLRNRVNWLDRVPFWRNILAITQARSVLDVGCNAGWNLRAIRAADRTVIAVGVDVNADAVVEARDGGLDASLMSARVAGRWYREHFDLVCTSGVLIHVAPAELPDTMQAIINASRRWVLAVEYAAPKEEEVLYRGNAERLWKRPFGDLYEAMGLTMVADTVAQGFDQCRAWLLVKR
jgi:pseudaminic acid biosynthesis-associated methylase